MLKRISLLAAIAFFAVACNQSAEKGDSTSTETSESSKQESFGAKITEENPKGEFLTKKIFNLY